jgi:anti-anti-sigma factor
MPETAPESGATRPDQRTLVLRGELDIAVAEDVIEQGLAALQSAGDQLTIDLAAVPFMDSSALGALVAIRNAAAAANQTVVVRHLQPSVRRIFEITGLQHAFGLGSEGSE